jgi:hypothetical protein
VDGTWLALPADLASCSLGLGRFAELVREAVRHV